MGLYILFIVGNSGGWGIGHLYICYWHIDPLWDYTSSDTC
jgi:hypothetical protein